MGLWVVVVVLSIVAAITWAGGATARERPDAALQVLDRRLAAGEIGAAEHAERRAVLEASPSTAGRRGWLWAAVVIGLAVLLLLVPLGTGWGGTWPGWMDRHMGWAGASGTSTATFPDAREVAVEAGDLWFRPERIEVEAGTEVNLRLTNTGRAFHDLTVPAADLRLDAEAGDEVVGGLRLTEPGTYEFYCSVPGHADAGMRGTIVVTS